METALPKWEYMELKITHGEVEIVDDEFQSAKGARNQDPYIYVKSMIEDGWELVTRSGSLTGEFTVVLKRPLAE